MNAMTKGLGFVFGVPVLFGVAYYSYAMVNGEKRMMDVCGQIQPGTSFAQLKEFAADHGLTFPDKDSGVILLAESRTYGRFACRIVMDAGIAKNSAYVLAD